MDKVKGVEIDPVREKLIELLREVQYQGNAVHGYHDKYIQNGELADHLIASGVVVSKMETTTKWIPVTERLPKEEDADITGCVLAIEKSDGFARRWEIQGIYEAPEYFTHWMTLPEPPKGE